jgi:hypothetical protein
MRFMMLMIPKGYENAAPDAVPDVEAVSAMARYNEELTKAGVLLSLDGLYPPSTGARACDFRAASRRSATARSPKQKKSSAAIG